MYSFNHHRIFSQILCVMLLFCGNSLFSFSPEPTLEPAPKPRKKYLGVTLSQNFAYRNYIGTDLPYPFQTEHYNNVLKPSVSFGLHFEQPLSNHSYSSSLKFKLLYEQFTSTHSQILSYKNAFSDSLPQNLNYVDINKINQFSLQSAYVQRLFSTNLSLLFGGTIAIVQNDKFKEYYELNSLKDTVLFSFNHNPPSQRFSDDYTEYIVNDIDRGANFRATINIGLQYDFHLKKFKIVPFVLYNHDFNSRYEDYSLYSFQTGIDISFPIR
jgi:hypothetical protein